MQRAPSRHARRGSLAIGAGCLVLKQALPMAFLERRAGTDRHPARRFASRMLAAVMASQGARSSRGWEVAADRGIRTPASIRGSGDRSHRIEGAEEHALPAIP
jgi:hypothetical protein